MDLVNLIHVIQEFGKVFDALTTLALQIGTFATVCVMVVRSLKK